MDLYKVTSLSPELLAEIRSLHFQTRHLVDQGVTGQYRSAFRGRGIEFEEVRPYHPGDDVRAIDWKVTARMNTPFIKSYREERELTVMVAVDVSASTFTGTRAQLREQLIARVGAVLTLIALNNNDRVGLTTFSNRLETYHPPRKGRSSVWRILQEVLTTGNANPGTDLGAMCTFLSGVLKRRSIVFLISDFVSPAPFEQPLATLAKRHDVTAVIVRDRADTELPKAGLICIREPESGEIHLVDSQNARVQTQYQELAKKARADQTTMFERNRVSTLELLTELPFMPELGRFLERRGKTTVRARLG